jgi:hypothetical protein
MNIKLLLSLTLLTQGCGNLLAHDSSHSAQSEKKDVTANIEQVANILKPTMHDLIEYLGSSGDFDVPASLKTLIPTDKIAKKTVFKAALHAYDFEKNVKQDLKDQEKSKKTSFLAAVMVASGKLAYDVIKDQVIEKALEKTGEQIIKSGLHDKIKDNVLYPVAKYIVAKISGFGLNIACDKMYEIAKQAAIRATTKA